MNRECFEILARKAEALYLKEAYDDIRKSILDYNDVSNNMNAIYRTMDILSFLLEKDGEFENE